MPSKTVFVHLGVYTLHVSSLQQLAKTIASLNLNDAPPDEVHHAIRVRAAMQILYLCAITELRFGLAAMTAGKRRTIYQACLEGRRVKHHQSWKYQRKAHKTAR
jgi:hypothetical protein